GFRGANHRASPRRAAVLDRALAQPGAGDRLGTRRRVGTSHRHHRDRRRRRYRRGSWRQWREHRRSIAFTGRTRALERRRADGAGGGAMAARASRELVLRLHDTLDGSRIDAATIRDALLHADREIGRSIASHTDAPGAATVALCAGTGMWLSHWLIAWVGDC